jgi:iron-sulfur cluster assembly accessory protein
MSVEIADPTQSLVITDTAAAHFRERIRRESAQAIRLAVKESGCTGYMYDLSLADAGASDDLDLPLGEDLHLYVDRASLAVLHGTRIDYVRDGLNRVLRFENPNAEDYCGCGESFSMKGEAGH